MEQHDKMLSPEEQYIRSEFLFPRRLVFKSDNIYAKALENSTIKEALKLD